MKLQKLLIGIPTLEYIHYQFVNSLTQLVLHLKNEGIDVDVFFKGETLIYAARDAVAEKAINGGYTHILWLDADMVFEKDLVDKMLEIKKPFVTAICYSRRYPYKPCIFKHLAPSKRYESPKEYPSEIFQIGGCGFACVLMEVEMLRKMKKLHYQMFMPTPDLGEDLAFCKRATDFGYELWADSNLRVGHIGHIPIYQEDCIDES